MSKPVLIRVVAGADGGPATIMHNRLRYEQYLSPEIRDAIRGRVTAWYWAELIDGVWFFCDAATSADLDAVRRKMMRAANTLATSRYPAAGGAPRRRTQPKPVSLPVIPCLEDQ